LLVEPGADLPWIEPKEVTPFHVRNAPLGDESADVPNCDPEVISDLLNRE
jgi:hypothetical protein